MKSVLGIDGGGTGSRFYFRESRNQSISFKGGPLQLSLKSSQELFQQILFSIQDAKLNKNSIEYIIAGIAGGSNYEKANELEQLLSNEIDCEVLVVSDAELTWNVLQQTPKDVLLIHGTGSAAIFLENNQLRLIGGKGPVEGDLLSGKLFSDLVKKYAPTRSEKIQSSAFFIDQAIQGKPPFSEILYEQISLWMKMLQPVLEGRSESTVWLHGGLVSNPDFKKKLIKGIKKNHPNLSILHNNADISKLATNIHQPEKLVRFKN